MAYFELAPGDNINFDGHFDRYKKTIKDLVMFHNELRVLHNSLSKMNTTSDTYRALLCKLMALSVCGLAIKVDQDIRYKSTVHASGHLDFETTSLKDLHEMGGVRPAHRPFLSNERPATPWIFDPFKAEKFFKKYSKTANYMESCEALVPEPVPEDIQLLRKVKTICKSSSDEDVKIYGELSAYLTKLETQWVTNAPK